MPLVDVRVALSVHEQGRAFDAIDDASGVEMRFKISQEKVVCPIETLEGLPSLMSRI